MEGRKLGVEGDAKTTAWRREDMGFGDKIKLKLNHPFGWRMGSCVERAGNGLMTSKNVKA